MFARSALLAILSLALVLGSATGHAQSTPQAAAGPDDAKTVETLQAEVRRLRSEMDVLRAQMLQVVQYLQQRDAAPQKTGAHASTSGAPALGRADAPVTIVEFSDFQCPYCQRYFSSTFPELKRDYIDTGKVRYVFLDYPLDQIHPQARGAAVAAHCAEEQGKFWAMHDLLFQNQTALQPVQLSQHARKLGLDGKAFDACLAAGRSGSRIAASMAEGVAAGVSGTPGFVIGKTAGNVVDGTLIVGAQPTEVFRKAIDDLLAAKNG